METLTIFCAVLAILLGVFQLFFPGIIDSIDQCIEDTFSFSQNRKINFRRISGILFITIGLVILYLTTQYDFNLVT